MSTTIKLVQGDDLPGVTLTIRDSNKAASGSDLDRKDTATWAPVDLVGANVTALVSVSGESSAIEPVEVIVVSPSVGEVMLLFRNTSFQSEVGSYQIEISVAMPAGRQTVYDMLFVDVRERIAYDA